MIPEKRLIFFTVAGGVFMSTMDSSMVNVALPAVMETYRSSLALTEWVILVYLLTITVLLLFWGKLCALIGCGRVYSGGMLVFALGSLFCSMAPTITFLILSRFVQGLGASMMMATGPALIKSIFPVARLGRGLGMIGVSTSLGLMTGPVLSGLLIHWLHWRAIFLVTVPVGLFFFLAGRAPLQRLTEETNGREKLPLSVLLRSGNSDPAGALLWTGVVVITVLLMTHASAPGMGIPAMLAVLAVCWAGFLWYERGQAAPFFPLALFGKRFFSMAVFSSMLSFAVLFMVLILTPFYLDRILGLSSDRIGYVMMALPMCVFIVSPIAGRLHDLIGARIVATGGLLCCFGSLYWMTFLTVDSSALQVALRLALIGFGQAMFLSPNSASALAGVSEDQVGITAGMLATGRNFGMLTGAALAALLFTLHFAAATGGFDMKDFNPAMAGEFIYSLKRTFQYGLVVSFAAVIFSLLRQKPAAEGDARS
ncbi:MAG: MFS transporter [Desulfobulbaceae bacterium]|nr:MFS transporter [Desulfobulbaceae bacterium]